MTFANNNNDFISFRHHIYKRDMNVNKTSLDSVVLQECGPRFEMQPYEVCIYL